MTNFVKQTSDIRTTREGVKVGEFSDLKPIETP